MKNGSDFSGEFKVCTMEFLSFGTTLMLEAFCPLILSTPWMGQHIGMCTFIYNLFLLLRPCKEERTIGLTLAHF